MDDIDSFSVINLNTGVTSPEIMESVSIDDSKETKNRRPPNAYILYCLEKRSSFREKYPEKPNIEISKMLGEEWKNLDESIKRPYKEKAKEMQKEFKAKHPEYKYEKARKKRQEQELLLQKSKNNITRTSRKSSSKCSQQHFDWVPFFYSINGKGDMSAANSALQRMTTPNYQFQSQQQLPDNCFNSIFDPDDQNQ